MRTNTTVLVLTKCVRKYIKDLTLLIYRSASVLWNYHQLNGLIRKTRISIANQRNRDEIVPEIMNSLFPISYNFDDIIFNLISMFDYLAGVIGLVLTEDTFKWYKGNQLVRTLRNDDKGFPETTKELLIQHSRWVDKIAGYRGGLYHKTTDMGSAEHQFDFNTGRDSVTFYIPDRALKNIPCFKKQEDVELVTGTYNLINGSLDIQMALLSICFNEK